MPKGKKTPAVGGSTFVNSGPPWMPPWVSAQIQAASAHAVPVAEFIVELKAMPPGAVRISLGRDSEGTFTLSVPLTRRVTKGLREELEDAITRGGGMAPLVLRRFLGAAREPPTNGHHWACVRTYVVIAAGICRIPAAVSEYTNSHRDGVSLGPEPGVSFECHGEDLRPQPPGWLCSHCGQASGKALKMCGGCGNVCFCDVACQRAAWSTHRAICADARAPRASTASAATGSGIPGPMWS